jgi:hypothetical protein
VSESVSPNGPERDPLPSLDAVAAAYTGEIPLGAAEPVHYDPDRIDRLSPCNLDLDEVTAAFRSMNPAHVTCALCAATLVDGQLAEPAADTQPLPAVDSWAPTAWDGPDLSDVQASYEQDYRDHLAAQVEQPRHSAQVGDVFTRCGVRVSQVERWTDDPATPVDCEPCRAALARAFERRAVERLAELVDEDNVQPLPDTDIRGALADDLRRMGVMPAVDPVENPSELAPRIGPVPPPAEHRTVGLEVLTDELRAEENARRIADAREADRKRDDGEVSKPYLLYAAATVGIVLRLDGRAVLVPETDATWVAHYRQPPDVLAAMLRQARHYADDHDGAELLMPGPDVLAALSGQPVGGFTATVELTYRAVRPTWLVLVDVETAAGERDSVWQEVAATSRCGDLTCLGGQDCRVVASGGKLRHHLQWDPVHVRIPAGQPAPEVTR